LAPAITVDLQASAEGPGTTIGPYKLLDRIGEGGMGTVYMAEQVQPVRRKVALKVIKPGMDSRQVIARFEAERQALAMMDHPNIAKVLDAGTTKSGLPYFVMELVRGVPITEYCDEAKLSVGERLELFVLVCRAIQHAHQKGIIHRDIKPTNVLVTLHDGVPVPKVIDFGVAKATGQSLTDRTLFTAFAHMVGTPLYMSPEQAELSGLDIDTRSDIYAMGVLLYELLTGTTPFDKDTFHRAAIDEMRRILREDEPPRPSTRLSNLGEAASTVSARRKADPKRLGSSLRGELDWIVMKALEKDRRRRYESANDFAADLMRYLTDKPVEAGPPSRWYRFKKYALRNRAALTSATLVVLALLVGIAGSVWQAVRATGAERKTSEALDIAGNELRRSWLEAGRLYDSLAKPWQYADEQRWGAMPREFLRALLPLCASHPLAHRVDSDVGSACRRIAEIHIQLDGNAYSGKESLERAEAIFEALMTVDPNNSTYRAELANCYELRTYWDLRIPRIRKFISIREELVASDPMNTQLRLDLARAHLIAGSVTQRLRHPLADVHLPRSKELYEKLCSENPGDPILRCALGATIRILGSRHEDLGRSDDAEQSLRAALAIHDDLAQRYPTRPQFLLNVAKDCFELGGLLLADHRHEKAAEYSGRAAIIFARFTNDDPDRSWMTPEMMYCLCELALNREEAGPGGGADREIRRLENLLGVERAAELHNQAALELLQHPEELRARSNAAAAVVLGKHAIQLMPDKPYYWAELGHLALRAGQWEEAIQSLLESKYHDEPFVFFQLAIAHTGRGDTTQARLWYQKAVGLMAEQELPYLPLFHLRTEAELALGSDPITPLLRDRIGKLRRPRGPYDPRTREFVERLANLLAFDSHWKEAADLFEQSWRSAPDRDRVKAIQVSCYSLAALKLRMGDLEGYRSLCAEMLERAGEADGEYVAATVARACSLLPNPANDTEAPLALGRFAASKFPQDFSSVLACGAAEFRAGMLRESIDTLTLARYLGDGFRRAQACLFLAMAHQTVGDSQRAREALKEAVQLLDPSCRRWTWWHDLPIEWEICQILLAEVENLIGHAAKPDAEEVSQPAAEESKVR
jgi:serine/threonine protein kinase